jgi:hypothetical protein
MKLRESITLLGGVALAPTRRPELCRQVPCRRGSGKCRVGGPVRL